MYGHDVDTPVCLWRQDTARRIAKVSIEAKLELDEEIYVESFRPNMMDIVHAWCKGCTFAHICTMTDIFEGMSLRRSSQFHGGCPVVILANTPTESNGQGCSHFMSKLVCISVFFGTMATCLLANSNILLSLERMSICKVFAGIDGIEGIAIEMQSVTK